MSYTNLDLQPGINTQVSKYASKPTWVASEHIRWLQGQLRKLGGWQKLTPTPVVGIARGMHAWEDLQGNPYLIIGTNERVQIYDGGQIEDVTPLRATDDVSPDFTTTMGDSTVVVGDTGNGVAVSDWVYMPVQVSVGGLILYGYYQVTEVVDADNYKIDAGSLATSSVSNGGAVPLFTTVNTSSDVTVTLDNHGLIAGGTFPVNISTSVGGLTILGTYAVQSVTDANNFVIDGGGAASSDDAQSENGGNVQFQYLLPTGGANPTTLTGWGGGNWGAGDWGLDNGSQSSSTPLRQWFFDFWGEDTIGNYTNGGLYIWMPPYATHPRMTIISEAPSAMTASFTSMPQQIVVALGAETGGTQDPNLVRWSDVADYTVWTASTTNQAGSFRIPTGSRIVGGMQTPLQGIIWTDLDVWGMQYVQPPFIFGFNRLGQGCGLIAARAAAVLGNRIFWMGTKQFFNYDGTVQVVPCDVWDYIFRNLDYTNADKIFAAPNTLFNEIWWFFPSVSGGSGEIDSYVKLNVNEALWDYGTMVRTAWEDQSVIGPPVGVDASGYIQQHETGTDDDGAPMVSYAVSSFADLSQGGEYIFVDQFMPSFQDISESSTLNVVLYYAKNAGSPVRSKGPYTVNSTTQYVNTRLRGRFVAAQMGSSDLGSFWQLGAFRIRQASDGRFG